MASPRCPLRALTSGWFPEQGSVQRFGEGPGWRFSSQRPPAPASPVFAINLRYSWCHQEKNAGRSSLSLSPRDKGQLVPKHRGHKKSAPEKPSRVWVTGEKKEDYLPVCCSTNETNSQSLPANPSITLSYHSRARMPYVKSSRTPRPLCGTMF